MAQGDGQGHQLGGFVTGVAEHHALVPGASEGVLVGLAVFGFQGLVDAHGDVRGLGIDGGEHAAGVAVKAALGVVVANVLDHLADDGGDIHIAGGGNLAHDVDDAGGGGGLTGHVSLGVLLDDSVQNGIGHLVANLIGMAFCYRFGSKELFCHHNSPF